MSTVAKVFERAAKRIQRQGHGKWVGDRNPGYDSRPSDYIKGRLMVSDAIWYESGMRWRGNLYSDVSDVWLGLTGFIDNGREGDHMVDIDESINKAQAVDALKACARIARMMESK